MTQTNKEQAAGFDDALDFEVSKTIMAAKSERRAWNITKGACGLTLLSWLALMLLMPLKTVEPYMVMVDKNTGQTQLLTTLEHETLSTQEVLERYWLTNYIRWREVYDWYTLQNDYDMTMAFSNPNVQKEYASIFEGENALDAKWGKRIKATTKILSIVNDSGKKMATIRFEKNIKGVEDKGQGNTKVWVATVSYQYNTEAVTEASRHKNPLGFEVTSYRVDPEFVR